MRLAGAATVGLVLVCLAPYWVGRKRIPAGTEDKKIASENVTPDVGG